MKRIFYISVLFLATLFAGNIANAMPREQEFEACLNAASTNDAVTKCRQEEINAVKQELINEEKQMSREPLVQPLVTSKDKNIVTMRNYFEKYMKSYCLYYTKANENNGYGYAYNQAKCELMSLLQYEDDINGIFYVSISDIKGW